MGAFDPDTIAFYAAEAKTYISARPDEVTSELRSFLEFVPAGGRILELGCGSGRDSKFMIGQGYLVDPTDGVPAMAQLAIEFSGIPARVMRFDELQATNAYDAVIACASLLHVPRSGLPDALHRVWRALKPGGLHLATYKTGGPEGWDEHGRYYNYPDSELAGKFYRSVGEWDTLEFDVTMGVGHFSKPSKWLKVLARKA